MGQTATGHFDGLGTGIQPGSGSTRILPVSGVPGVGTNEVQTLTIGGTPTGGTFKLRFESQTTAAITWSSTNATLLADINAKLDALTSLGTSGCVAAAGTLTLGIGTITLTFGAARASQAVELITVADNSLTGTTPTLAIAETTPGVDATYRGWPKGQVVKNVSTGIVYTNTGTASVPVWTVVGAQT